jgi:outer membrane protein assembly factor BamB/ribosomal protein L7/L12
MSENSPKTLTCPSCGAPLEFDGSSAFVLCKFCKTTALLPGFKTAQDAASPASLAEIRSLAQGGNLIEAIRRYRELTDVGLKEAKEAVELLASGKVVEARQVSMGPISAEETGRVLEQVQELLRSGNKIEAIRRYREAADVSLTKAREVVERVEAALTGLPIPPRPGYEIREMQPIPAQVERRRQPWLGFFILSFIIVITGVVLALALSVPGGPFSPMLIANGPAVLVAPGTSEPGLAAAFYSVTDETYLVGMLDADSGKLRWQSDPLSGDGYVDAIAQAGGLVYAASLADLLAYQAGDGSLAWHAVMPDRLNYGDASLLVTGGRVLAITLDQSIQAYDAATGTLVWTRRLSGYDRTLRMVGSSLVVYDYIGEDYTYSLVFLDPTDGREQRVITPACPYDEYSSATLDPDSGLLYDDGENALYLVFDSSPGCIQRLDLASGQISWQTLDEDWYTFSSDGFNGLLMDDRLYFSTGDQILAVDKTTGLLQTLLADEDNELLPLAVSADTLIVRLRRTRGSERFELRGLDIASGRMLWQMDMGNARPVDPPDEMAGLVDENDAGWTWSLVAGQLVLIQFQAAPTQLLIQTVDPADGTLAAEITIPLKSVTSDFYSIPEVIAWRGELVYFSLDATIFCVNILTGEVIFHYQ